MRLRLLHEGFRPLQKAQLAIIRRLVGQLPGPIAVMSHRRKIFGKPFAACLQEAMRGKSEWSVGEREIFSAFVSKLNDCRY
ncbi:MAG TPA: hypothetical protein VHE35_19890 [Kofleriaceae bacterium]|nr:hypothetical protein [Kofleriaceae bacterium]